MKYYRVENGYDNRVCYKDGKYVGTLIGGELVTEKEADKLGIKDKEELYIIVDVKPRDVYMSFGVRTFIMDDGTKNIIGE